MRKARAPENSTLRRHLEGHLEGWRAGVLTIVLAVLGASLAVPRATTPEVLPYPTFDTNRALEADRIEQQRCQVALREELPHSTRLVGEHVRRLGIAMTQDAIGAERLRRNLRTEVRKHLNAGHAEALLQLRALQATLFITAVRDWERTDEVTSELEELGGDFYRQAARDWRAPSGRLVFSDEELRLLFRVRWGLLTGVHREHPFGPSLNEFRHYYALLLMHPSGSTPQDRILSRLGAVGALARVDGSYPASFASGVLLAELGDFGKAAQQFEQHLKSQGDGPWTLLARNHLLATRPALPDP